MSGRVRVAALGFGLFLLGVEATALQPPVPLIQAHAHNDYQHDRPLLDALDHIVKTAHASGCLVRFWAIPPREDFWRILLDNGVDFINADNLDQLQRFLLQDEVSENGPPREGGQGRKVP